MVEMYLTADRNVSIHTIHTTFHESEKTCRLKIYGLNRRRLNLSIERFEKDGMWSFSLEPPFEMKADCSYHLLASSDEMAEMTEQSLLDYKDSVNFSVKRESVNGLVCHCIRGLDFTLLD